MPDVRLIDANALVKQIEGTHCKDCNSYNGAMCRACEWMDAMDYIEDAPTVDAQPVKHGKWLEYSRNALETYIECTNCCVASRQIHLQMVTSNAFGLPNYCPNCGAKMDGDG